MQKISALVTMIGCIMFSSIAFAGGHAHDFVGTWIGEYCTMDVSEGLSCGKSAEIVIHEQKNDLVRGKINIKGKDYTLAGTMNENGIINYIDALNSSGTLELCKNNLLRMKAVNRCLTGNVECAHSGTFKRK